MKKWLIVGTIGIVGAVAVMAGIGFTEVRANETALEELRAKQGVVVLNVGGMT